MGVRFVLRRSKWRLLLLICFAITSILVTFQFLEPNQVLRGAHRYLPILSPSPDAEPYDEDQNDLDQPDKKQFFHLIVPATRDTRNLCRLILSSTALGYPTPVFVNWGYEENKDRYKEHLAKVSGTLRYLSRLPKRHDSDLALLVDGFDLWFQLRPEVVIQRYNELIKASNERLGQQLKRSIPFQVTSGEKTKMVKNTLLFGPDKICWPEDPSRTACWAVPNSTLPEYAFGPETDSGKFREHYRPRWLNSGTIMGPISDIRRLFKATENRIKAATADDVISDQYHMANLWGEQEYSRFIISGGQPPMERATVWKHDGWNGEGHFERVHLQRPKAKDPLKIPDFHITIDYESRLFQTMAYYKRYLGWVRYDGATEQGKVFSNQTSDSWTRWVLPDDISSSPAPFPSTEGKIIHRNQSQSSSGFETAPTPTPTNLDAQPQDLDLPTHNTTWQDLLLGTNVITKQVFAVLHFTPPKSFRDKWWNRMWFFSYASAIMRNSMYIQKGPYIVKPEGKVWHNYEVDALDEIMSEHKSGGAFADSGAWISWRKVCAKHEQAVFQNP